MSAHALPAPRRISLPKVKFKRPRWPRGSRFWLVMLIFWALYIGRDIGVGDWSFGGVPLDVICGGWSLFEWRRSRRDDDGPSAT